MNIFLYVIIHHWCIETTHSWIWAVFKTLPTFYHADGSKSALTKACYNAHRTGWFFTRKITSSLLIWLRVHCINSCSVTRARFLHCALWTKLSLSKDTCAALSGSCGEAASIEGQWCVLVTCWRETLFLGGRLFWEIPWFCSKCLINITAQKLLSMNLSPTFNRIFQGKMASCFAGFSFQTNGKCGGLDWRFRIMVKESTW